ncbi:MAG TPA: TraR/DksA family transcriptional regulator [Bryobacteraceae bacterium]|nr:TraR/DksA family transcriptional regulator [Bryobacteraceae bacterium]
MEAVEIQRFKGILQALRERVEETGQGRDDIAIENTPDALDQVQSASDRELAIRRLEVNASLLGSIRSALDRIDDGTYGSCIRCESDISPKRLQAVPWAAFCLECQKIAEKEGIAAPANGVARKGAVAEEVA